MREFLMHISYPAPLRLIKKMARVNPLIINYHMVEDNRLPHVINLYKYRNVTRFMEDLDFLIRNFRPLGMLEFLHHLHENTRIPENSFLLTFDDGFREVYDIVAPVLSRKKLTATFFLTTNFIDNRELGYDNKKSLLIEYLKQPENKDACNHIIAFLGLPQHDKSGLQKTILSIPYANRFLVDTIASELKYSFETYLNSQKPYLTSDQVKELIKTGFTFGAHSIDHPRFSELTLDEQLYQAISSILEVAEKFSLPYKVFAFPYSDKKVSLDFFNKVSAHVDATFGTHGLLLDEVGNNFQRIGVEKYSYSACKVIKFNLVRKILYQYAGREIMKREKYAKL